MGLGASIVKWWGGLWGKGQPVEKPMTPSASVKVDTEDIEYAFRLGWHFAELHAGSRPKETTKLSKPGELLSYGELAAEDRYAVLLGLVKNELGVLATCLKGSNVELPDFFSVAPTGPKDGQCSPGICDLHSDVMKKLWEADFRLGKAYGLGRSLADTILLPSRVIADPTPIYLEQFHPSRIKTLVRWLKDLSSVLPEHSSRAVRAGLIVWWGWVATTLTPTSRSRRTSRQGRSRDFRRLNDQLERQGDVWRALLSGEKTGTSLLKIADYLSASAGLVGHFVVKYAGLVVLGIAASFGVAWAVKEAFRTLIAAGTLSGVGAAAAALGISWAGIGSLVWKGVKPAAGSMWKAAVNEAVAGAALVQARTHSEGPALKRFHGLPSTDQFEESVAEVD